MDVTEHAAREWFGYGTWAAPYWFVGMEPGGDGDATHEAWSRLGSGELIDCKAHHLECGFARWHGSERPPTQSTWRRLIQLLLAFKGEATDMDTVARYQRDRLGCVRDETALIELSAHHAVNLSIWTDRTAYRDERIELIRSRLDEHHPRFVMFYGRTYRAEYERITGLPFRSDGSVWRGNTLCVLTTHPAARSAPPAENWIALGKAIRTTLEQRRGAALAGIDSARSRTPPEMTPASVGDPDYGDEVPIMRSGVVAGCIIREGKSVRVDSRESDGSHRVLGYYERAETSTFPRKVCEIDDIFDAWRDAKIGDGSEVKIIWRGRECVPAFREQPGAIKSGCSVVEDDGVPIAYVYKIRPTSALWVDA